MLRAVYFDAVGSLIESQPSPARVYFEIGRRYGSCLTCDEIAHRFRLAFRREDERDREQGWRTDEPREEARWRSIVATVLDDVRDREACFRDLWQHFAKAESWRCLDGVQRVLAELA